MTTQDTGFTPASVNAIGNEDFHTARQPVRVAWEPYGRPEHGDPDPNSPHYRRIDGHVTYENGYLHIECINGEEFIIAPGDTFAPTKEEWLGEDIVREFDNPAEDLPPAPFEDEQWAIGKLDGDTCTAIGINTVILLPDNPQSTQYGVCNVADVVSDVIHELKSFDAHGHEHALETVNSAYKNLDRARKALRGEYKEIRVTGIPTENHNASNANITFTHPD